MDYYNATGIFDNSTYSNFGTFNGGLNYSNLTEGKRGQGIIFDGSNDYITVNNNENLQIRNNLTISSWVKFSETQINVPIVAKWAGEDKGYLLMIDYHLNNRLFFAVSVSGVNREAISSNTYNDGEWHHVVGMFNGSNVLLYIDNGAEKIIGDATIGPIDDPSLNLVIGDYGIPGMYYNGSIDEVMIFNRSLSETEILALYNSQSNKFNATFENLEDGQHNYTVYAIDEAGNYNISGERNFIAQEQIVGENSCGTLDSANTVYTLTSNVSSQGTCFTIAAENITLDCSGYWINYSINGTDYGRGVYANQFNATIKNCNVIDGNMSSTYSSRQGILFSNQDNGTIYNNTITSNNSNAISINLADYNNITNNTLRSYKERGIELYLSSNNTIQNNYIPQSY